MLLQRWRQLFKERTSIPESEKIEISKPSLQDITHLVSDRRLFDATLYTPLEEAWEELQRRRQDKALEAKIDSLLGDNIPGPLVDEPKAVLFRHVLTPNYETRRFVSLLDGFGKLEPLFWEYRDDKYTPNNELKRAIGRLFFYHGTGKRGGLKIDSLNVLDFNTANGRPISSLETPWGQNFIEFHHEFFSKCFRSMPHSTFDASNWFKQNGQTSGSYYKSFMTLFIRHGVLFENMMLDDSEIDFAKNIFLPAFIDVFKETGLKPLVVALEPTHIEGDRFWMCYPGQDKAYVEEKLLKAHHV
jgi:hypothetical protein